MGPTENTAATMQRPKAVTCTTTPVYMRVRTQTHVPGVGVCPERHVATA
ncbi:MAG TPA: hypothetical protein PLA56_00120 [Nitrosomonas sp.]|nr:hypothetical protein [Nitrosomonas sp.]HNC40145.1 hypothetical protein [Nitrosomonas sp.]HND36202.1 hypothetical protein [Nitrosomonas sp.]HNG35101.1 hypothetical protein [Nitrosomonas sp.]HNH50978.1 hypothetical protein [Nitrosomonas sp.]